MQTGESYTSILNSVVDSFEINPDLLILTKIDDSISKSAKSRAAQIESEQAKVNQLQKELDSLIKEVSTLTDPETTSPEILAQLKVASATASASSGGNLFELLERKSIELDNTKVLLAKKLNELDSQINLKKINIAKLNEQLDKLNAQTENLLNENLLSNPDSKIMKINLYKSLGLLIEDSAASSTGDSGNDKILIYNKENDLTSILNVNDKYSDYFITNHIWDRL